MSQLYISRAHVRKSLERAAKVRAGLTVVTALAILALIGLAFASGSPYAWAAVVALLVVPTLVGWLATPLLCRRTVECPACKGSLWDIGTGGFNPGQMKIKDEVTGCPHCGAVLI